MHDYGLPLDRPIGLDNFFAGKQWVGENFLYTRDAFEKAGGYPTDHSFDTQGFGMRFLAAGLNAYPCPGTYFYHRTFAEREGYFERAYTSGEFSVGIYLILREFIGMFSEKIRDLILNYDIFTKNSLEENIMKELLRDYKENPDAFFAQGLALPFAENPQNPEYLYQHGDFAGAFDLFTAAKENYANAGFDLIRYSYAATNGKKMSMNIYRATPNVPHIRAHRHNPFRLPFIHRVRRKLKKIFSRSA